MPSRTIVIEAMWPNYQDENGIRCCGVDWHIWFNSGTYLSVNCDAFRRDWSEAVKWHSGTGHCFYLRAVWVEVVSKRAIKTWPERARRGHA
jgi:hypothetical protein